MCCVCACVYICMCAYVRACVRACVHASARVYVFEGNFTCQKGVRDFHWNIRISTNF